MTELKRTIKDCFRGKGYQPQDNADPVLNVMISGIILFLPLFLARSKYQNGFSPQDIIFFIMTLMIALRAIMYTSNKQDDSYKQESRDRHRCIWNVSNVLLVLCFLCVAAFAWQISHASILFYRAVFYVMALWLTMSVRASEVSSGYYLKLFIFPLAILYVFLYIYVFARIEVIPAVGLLINDLSGLAPLLLLGCAVTSILYMSAMDYIWRYVYSALTVAGFCLLFLYADMAAFCILFFFLLFIPVFYPYTYAYLQKELALLFMFAFSASNVGLIPYFGAKGLYPNRVFNLEYSIYIDIMIAVFGLAISRYMDRFSDDTAPETKIPVIPVLFRYARYLSLTALFTIALFGRQISEHYDSGVGAALGDFADALVSSASTGFGEWWYMVSRWGIVGILIPIVLLTGFIIYAYRAHGKAENEQPWILIGGLFLVQSFFYPIASISAPIYIVYTAFALPNDSAAEKQEIGIGDLGEEADAEEDVEFLSLDDKESPHVTLRHTRMVRAVRLCLQSAFGGVCIALLLVIFVVVISRAVISFSVGDDRLALTVQAQELMSPDLYRIDDELEPLSWERASSELYLGLIRPQPDEPIASPDSEETGADETDTEQISISNGDYRIYDPGALYEKCNDIVTAKPGGTRLRTDPSIGDEGEVVYLLPDNEKVVRIGIGENGWSKVRYDSRICYAVTEYLTVLGEYHGDPSELLSDDEETVEETEEVEAAETEGEENEQSVTEEAGQTEKTEKPAETKPNPGAYSIQWTANNTVCTIWSSGVKQGTLRVTDGENAQTINVYSDYYTGSGKDRRRYFSISVPAGDTPYSIQADSGFVTALKNMGYSGLYYNKQIIEW